MVPAILVHISTTSAKHENGLSVPPANPLYLKMFNQIVDIPFECVHGKSTGTTLELSGRCR